MVQREVKDLQKGIAHLHNCTARYNALIADNAALKVQLVNDNFHLETKIGHELQVCHPAQFVAQDSACCIEAHNSRHSCILILHTTQHLLVLK